MPRIDHPSVREHWRLAILQGLEERGWNQRELREKLEEKGLEISQQTMSTWTTQGVIPDAYACLRTCQVLGMDLEWALTRKKTRGGEEESAVRAGMLEAANRMAAVLEEIRTEVTGASGSGARGLAAHLASERGVGKKRAQPGGAVRRADPR